jgi:hypothetical protein
MLIRWSKGRVAERPDQVGQARDMASSCAMAESRRVGMIDKVPSWVDWLAAVIIGVAVFNLNVTSAGDPLSGVRGMTDGPSPAGISETARTTFYAAITVGGSALAAGALIMVELGRGLGNQAVLAIRAFGLLAAAGIAGLLLDYTDGPIRTVEFVVYVSLVLASIRFLRLGLATRAPRSANKR